MHVCFYRRLGRVNEFVESDESSDDVSGGHIASGKLVVSSGEPAEVFHFVDEPFDLVTLAIDSFA